MNPEEIYNQIQVLPSLAGDIRRREPKAIELLRALYLKVTGSTVYAGCKGCHIKAANYLMSLTLQQLITMSEKKFTLKKGVSIEFPFRSGQLLMQSNLSDAKAAEYLINNPAGLDHFSDFPTNEAGELSLEQWYPSEVASEVTEPEEEQQQSQAEEQPAEESPEVEKKSETQESEIK